MGAGTDSGLTVTGKDVFQADTVHSRTKGAWWSGQVRRFWSQNAWGQFPALSLSGCAVWDKLPYLSEPPTQASSLLLHNGKKKT